MIQLEERERSCAPPLKHTNISSSTSDLISALRTARTMAEQEPASKRQKVDQESSVFHPTLFDPLNVDELRTKHDASSPYKHAVINQLFNQEFLNKARKEITEQLSFREKETDICTFFPLSPLQLASSS